MKYVCLLAMLCAIEACTHMASQSPAQVDLSGTWKLDAKRSDPSPLVGRKGRSEAEENEERATLPGSQTGPHFGGPMPLLPMITATEMTIAQDPHSMGIAYPGQPYRDLKWGTQKRGLFTIEAGWDEKRLIVETRSEPMNVREIYSLSDAGNTLTLHIDLAGRHMDDHHVTRVFTRAPAPPPIQPTPLINDSR